MPINCTECRRKSPALVLVLLSLAALPGLAAPFDELTAQLEQIRVDAGVAGAIVLIVDANGIRQAAALGVADRSSGRPMQVDTWIRIGSVTKSFVGLAFLRLDASGALPLDATLAELGSRDLVANRWYPRRQVTIARLLEHSAGLGDLVAAEWAHKTPVTQEQALAIAPHSRRLRWPPGLHSSYSNSGAGIAAAAMERATGLQFESFLLEQVTRPMGMPEATFSGAPAVRALLATGYDRDGRTVLPYWHMIYPAFGGLNLPFTELARLPQMLLGKGVLDGRRIFSADQVARMESPRTTAAAAGRLEFGYGLGNYHQLHRGFTFHGHGGDADGYLTHFAYSHELAVGYCVVINAFQGPTLSRMRLAIAEYLVGGRNARFQPGVPQPVAHLRRLTGRYQQATQRFDRGQPPAVAEIELSDNRLWLVRGRRREHLIPLSRWHFRRRFESRATTAFAIQDDQMLLQGPFGNYRRPLAQPAATPDL